MLTNQARRFLDSQRVASFATVDCVGRPHVVPICYVLSDNSAYFTIDRKPKQSTNKPLQRIRNLQQNPHVVLMVDRYDEDWTQLGWVMVHGKATLLDNGEEHINAQLLLTARYPQLSRMHIRDLPVISIQIKRVVSWGNLDTD